MADTSKKKKKNYLFYDFVRVTAGIPGMIWLRPRILYENEAARHGLKGGVLLIANHSGFCDPIYLMVAIWKRRHHFVCIKDFFNGKLLSWLFSSFHCIPIDRENFSMDSLRMITEELKADHLVSMFPEGAIHSEGGNMAPFKSGMVLIAMQSKKPIVPVYVKKPRKFYNRLTVAVGEPVDVCALYGGRPSLSQIEEVSALLHEKEEKLREMCGDSNVKQS